MTSLSRRREEKQEHPVGFFIGVVLCFVAVSVLEIFWPDVIPFYMFEFWTWKGSWAEILPVSLVAFIWAVGITFIARLLALVMTRGESMDESRSQLVGDMLLGTLAAVVEEAYFRWLLFYSEIAGFKLINLLTCGVVAWIYTHAICPVANFVTLGYLEPWLSTNLIWAIGAAVVSSNGKFRDGHKYQGFFGWINSWFGGMYLFYVMFNHGLFAAITMHFVYNMVVAVTVQLLMYSVRGGQRVH